MVLDWNILIGFVALCITVGIPAWRSGAVFKKGFDTVGQKVDAVGQKVDALKETLREDKISELRNQLRREQGKPQK